MFQSRRIRCCARNNAAARHARARAWVDEERWGVLMTVRAIEREVTDFHAMCAPRGAGDGSRRAGRTAGARVNAFECCDAAGGLQALPK